MRHFCFNGFFLNHNFLKRAWNGSGFIFKTGIHKDTINDYSIFLDCSLNSNVTKLFQHKFSFFHYCSSSSVSLNRVNSSSSFTFKFSLSFNKKSWSTTPKEYFSTSSKILQSVLRSSSYDSIFESFTDSA